MDIFKGINDLIIGWVTFDFSKLQEVYDLASMSPTGTNAPASVAFPAASLWSASQNVALQAVAPVAVTVAGIFFSMELFKLLQRNQSSGIDMFYSIIMTLVKMSICIVLMKNMTVIIALCFSISSEISKNVISLTGLEVSQAEDLNEKFKDFYNENGDFLGLLWNALVAMFGNLIMNLAFTLATIICQLRFLEIYVFVALSPIAFCTFCNSEYKNIGVSYIKRLLALGLQGTFIMIVCYLFLVIVASFSGDSFTDPSQYICAYSGFSILLIIALFQTGGWSKALLQAN